MGDWCLCVNDLVEGYAGLSSEASPCALSIAAAILLPLRAAMRRAVRAFSVSLGKLLTFSNL